MVSRKAFVEERNAMTTWKTNLSWGSTDDWTENWREMLKKFIDYWKFDEFFLKGTSKTQDYKAQ